MTNDFASTTVQDRSRKYLRGKDGWIFLDHDRNRVMDQVRGELALGPDGVEAWRDFILERNEICRSLGAAHVMLVAPNKEVVYSEALPEDITVSEHRPVNQIIERLAQDGRSDLLYPLDALLQAKAKALVFPKTDTHWTGFGAFVGYVTIAARLTAAGIPLTKPDPSRLSFESVDLVGDLGIKLDPPVSAPTLSTRIRNPAGRLVFDNGISNRGRLRVFINRDTSLPTCLMFGDSFGSNLLPFLKESFGVLVYVYGRAFDRELMKAYQPDVVLTEVVERFLIDPPVQQCGFTYAAVVRNKLKQLSPDDRQELEKALTTVDPAVFRFRTLYRALLDSDAGRPLSSTLVEALRREHPDNAVASEILAAESARKEQDLKSAQLHAERATAAKPDAAAYHRHLGLKLLQLGRNEEAEVAFRKAIALNGSRFQPYYQLAQTLFRLEKYRACIETLNDFLALTPTSADGWQLKALCYDALGEVDEAADCYSESAALRPDWAWPLMKLAGLRLRSKTRPDQGLAAVERLLALNLERRQRAEAFLMGAQLHAANGEPGNAVEWARRATEIYPEWAWARTELKRLSAHPDYLAEHRAAS